VIRVFDRHKEAEPAIAAFEPTLLPAAGGFNEAYDDAQAQSVSRAKAMGAGHGAVDTLFRKGQGWLGLLAKDVPGFDPSSFGDTRNVPDDVIRDAQQILRVVDRAVADGVELPYAEALRSDLEPAIAAAQAEWGGAGESRADEARLIKAVREAAATFRAELIAFRRTLRAHVGTSHPDYQKLRAGKVSTPDEDDDEVAASLPNAQEAALEPDDEADLAEAS
jgi:hypothetical protein